MTADSDNAAADAPPATPCVYMVGAHACADERAAAALADGFEVERCDDYRDLMRLLARRVPDVIVMGDDAAVGEPGMLTKLALEFRRQYEFPYLPIVVLARTPDVDMIVECIKRGASHVVSSQEAPEKLAPRLREAADQRRLMEQVHQLADTNQRLGKFGDLVGVSPAIQNVFTVIRNVAATDASVFISGESGTGKELVASALHRFSRRRDGEFVCVNCAAIPKDLLESELFGHEKGAFTGAEAQRIGSCERADGGTLFLDEVGEMDVRLQSKMLRFLQDFSFTRVGGNRSLHTNTRVIAATNRDPAYQIQDGSLREDLFYRLNVVPLELPPLRERPEDIAVLAQHFLNLCSEKYTDKYFVDFSPEAMRLMLCYNWPGNVRQLQNVIERIVVLANTDRVTPELFPEEIRAAAENGEPPDLSVDEAMAIAQQALSEPEPQDIGVLQDDDEDVLPFDEVEKRAILGALQKCDGDISKAARKLGLSRATIYRKLEKYGEK